MAESVLPEVSASLSESADPLERLCQNAGALATIAWLLVKMADTQCPPHAPHLADLVARLIALLKAVSSAPDETWEALDGANSHAIAECDVDYAGSHVSAAELVAQKVYRALFEAAAGQDAARRWLLSRNQTLDDYQEIDVAELTKHWESARIELAKLSGFRGLRLDAEIYKEFARAKNARVPIAELASVTPDAIGGRDKGGRSSRWNALVDFDQEYRKTHSAAKDEEVCLAYRGKNGKWANRHPGEPTVDQLRDARKYRNQANAKIQNCAKENGRK